MITVYTYPHIRVSSDPILSNLKHVVTDLIRVSIQQISATTTTLSSDDAASVV